MSKILELSENNWSKELIGAGLRTDIVRILNCLILCRQNSFFHPCDEEQISFMKEHLSSGVSVGVKEYDIMVYQPDDDKFMSFCFFLPKWSEGKVRYLSEC